MLSEKQDNRKIAFDCLRFSRVEEKIMAAHDNGNDVEDDLNDDNTRAAVANRLASFTAPKELLQEQISNGNDNSHEDDVFGRSRRIIDNESDYSKRRLKRQLSPVRNDAFAVHNNGTHNDSNNNGTSFADVMREEQLKREEELTRRAILAKMQKEEEENITHNYSDKERDRSRDSRVSVSESITMSEQTASGVRHRKRSRWDSTETVNTSASAPVGMGVGKGVSEWDTDLDDNHNNNYSNNGSNADPSQWDMPTPQVTTSNQTRSRWDETPLLSSQMGGGSTRRKRWDETPMLHADQSNGNKNDGNSNLFDSSMATPVINSGNKGSLLTTSSAGMSASLMATPLINNNTNFIGMETPIIDNGATGGGASVTMTPELQMAMRWERDIIERNRPLTDEELDAMLPGAAEGYKIVEVPDSYVPIHTPARKLLSTPMMGAYPGMTPMYSIPDDNRNQEYDVIKDLPADLPEMKPEDYEYFAPLLKAAEEDELSSEEAKERKIMRLLLKVKNGTPPQRKVALRQLTDKAREFGAGPIFNQVLPLLMSPTLEDQERHLLVKVIDRVLYKLDELVRPYVHKILVVIEPLLIDEDWCARVEGREIISNLSKAAGLATMIAAMRPDIDNIDEYVRNTTARAFSVVASALGIPALLPFLKAVCQSKKSWQARHTGTKIVQQIAILMGCAVLPHLKSLVDIIEKGLSDENQKVRTICALAISALAEASAPFGVESFDSVLRPLWKGIRTHRNKVLAAFLKAIGFIIPLMDATYAAYYTKEVMIILIREFQSPDEEMKKIVLKVVKQCVGTDGVEPDYVKTEIVPEFFKNFWVRRMALDRRNYRQLVETTVEISLKVGCSEIVSRVVEDLKDESEPYRKMVMETVDKVITEMGASDIDSRLEELLIDGVLYAFQEQTNENSDVMLNGFSTVVNALGTRSKPYLPQICGTIKWRLNNKSAKIREQAADLIGQIAGILSDCEETQLLNHLGVVLYEYLGEEYPEVLGSILGALTSIVNVVGMTHMTPPIKDLLPRLTPILKNRHEKVQEHCIDLVGRIADRGAEFVPAKEWMRICFELLEMLRAHKKAIRRATVNTFGYIAKAIGPQDVLVTLLNNLKVQERQNRVCTTVAIAIVAETCAPFTVLPGVMNEYRTPELNVQNGVLKALSFLFEYIGEMGKDYIYAITPLLEDALMDRDLVHRQTACTTAKHMALGVAGLGCEDSLIHLLNLIWPNVFEDSPHVINAVLEAIESMRLALGAPLILGYTLQGLFHPARKVRDVYWKIYNTLYIGSQEALVAGYPKLTDTDQNDYGRHELDLFL